MSTAVLVVHSGELGELLATQFAQYGLTCELAPNGERALALALHAKPKVAVVDAEILDVDGLDLAELVKRELNVPVVVTYSRGMAYGDDGAAFSQRLEHLDACFAKPFRSLALIGTVAELIGHPLASVPGSQEGFPIEQTEEMDTGDIHLLEDAVQQVWDADPQVLDAAVLQPEQTIDEDAEDPFAGFNLDDEPESETASTDVSHESALVAEAATKSSESSESEATTLPLLWEKVQREDALEPASDQLHGPSRGQLPLTPKTITETLDALHQSQTTAEIWMVSGNTKRAILLSRGVITGARSNDPTEDLARLCLRRQVLTLDQVRRAQKHAELDTSVRSFAAAVLTLRMATEEQIKVLLLERAKRVVCGGFLAPEGTLRVTYQRVGAAELIPISLRVGAALARAMILTEPMQALRAAAPDDARFAPEVGSPYGLEELDLSGQEAHLVVSMDGTKTIADLATLHDNCSERTLRGVPGALARIGLIRLVGRGPAEAKRIVFF